MSFSHKRKTFRLSTRINSFLIGLEDLTQEYSLVNPFHLAITVSDLKETALFYTTLFDARVGRKAEKWIDFDFLDTSFQHI